MLNYFDTIYKNKRRYYNILIGNDQLFMLKY